MNRVGRLATHLLLIAGAFVMLYPLLWMVGSSFKPASQIFGTVNFLPDDFILSNYRDGWFALGFPFARFFANSFLISALCVVGNVFSCSLAAYAFARLSFRFRRLWFAIMLVTIMLPIHVLIVPQYTLFHWFGWIDTYLPLTVPHFLAVDAFFVFLMVQFIRSLPTELDDAARIDGCGPFQIYLRIVLPLMKPALITTAIFTFIWSWDNFFSQVIFISSLEKLTVPLALRAFIDATGTEESAWGPMFAMTTVAMTPVFVFFLIFQKQITEGISTTGLKG
ncbi:carbohydrate ABC transporter permease [Flindersiella endophytica]